MWIHLNAFLFGDQRRKWIVVLPTLVIAGLLTACISPNDRLLFPVIIVILIAVFPVVLILYDQAFAIVVAGHASSHQSALDLLAHEHSKLRAALDNLSVCHTPESRLAALNDFIDEFVRHDSSEEDTFFSALTKKHPTRLAPQIRTFTGNHWPIRFMAFEMFDAVNEPSFASRVARLRVLLEDHIQQEEKFFPEILRVAGYDFLVRLRNEM